MPRHTSSRLSAACGAARLTVLRPRPPLPSRRRLPDAPSAGSRGAAWGGEHRTGAQDRARGARDAHHQDAVARPRHPHLRHGVQRQVRSAAGWCRGGGMCRDWAWLSRTTWARARAMRPCSRTRPAAALTGVLHVSQARCQAAVHARDGQAGDGGLHPAHCSGLVRGLGLVRGAQLGQQHWGRRGRGLVLPADVHPVQQRPLGRARLRQLPVRRELRLLRQRHGARQLQPGVLLLQDLDDVRVRVRHVQLWPLARPAHARPSRKYLVSVNTWCLSAKQRGGWRVADMGAGGAEASARRNSCRHSCASGICGADAFAWVAQVCCG